MHRKAVGLGYELTYRRYVCRTTRRKAAAMIALVALLGCSKREQVSLAQGMSKVEAPAQDVEGPAQEKEGTSLHVRLSTGESRHVVRGDLLMPVMSGEVLNAVNACIREAKIDRARFRVTSISRGDSGVNLNVVPIHDGVPAAHSPILFRCGTEARLPQDAEAHGKPTHEVSTKPAISLDQAAAAALEEMRGRADWREKKDEDVIADLLLTHASPTDSSSRLALVWAFGTAGTPLRNAVLIDAVDGSIIAGPTRALPTTHPETDTVGRIDARIVRQIFSFNNRAVFFANARVGYVAGYDGSIIKTVNGGQTWRPQESGTTKPLQALYFVDELTGYAAGGPSSTASGGAETVLLKTTDGGDTWIAQHAPESTEATAIAFSDAENGVVVGLGFILRTTNGGLEWTRAEAATHGLTRAEAAAPGLLKNVRFLSPQVGIVTGLFGQVLRSEDAGETWIAAPSPTNSHIYAFSQVNSLVGYGAGQGRMIKTMDGGKSWKELPESPSEIYGLHFLDEQTGVAVGRGRGEEGCFGGPPKTAVVHVTRDGGRTWASNTRPWGIDFLHAVHFPDAKTGYAVGHGPLIVKLTLNR